MAIQEEQDRASAAGGLSTRTSNARSEEPRFRLGLSRAFLGKGRIGQIARLIMTVGIGLADQPGPGAVPANAPAPFSFDTVRERARALAAKPYQADTKPQLPGFLANLTYDQYEDIRFRPESAPWWNEGLRFDIMFFPRGYLYKAPVRFHLLETNQVRDVVFSPEQFDYGKNRFPRPVPPGLGYAGFRVVYRIKKHEKWNEVASFLGASYFRLVGLHQRYGASARGLAINTAEPSGEEFPRFTEFWIRKPGQFQNYLEIFGLLDSPSGAGAYRFILKPGNATVAEIEASLFLRQEPAKLGLAPLTSMYLFGQNRTRRFPDFRPQVHDSDGLLIQSRSGGWLWRPLINPERKFHLTDFPEQDLPGFGLLQRDRDFRDYQDLQTHYELHPSLWVQPRNNWGSGVVQLVEIPSSREYDDNITVYWIPAQKPAVGQELHWSYTLSALSVDPDNSLLLRVHDTLIRPEHDDKPPLFVVDFTGGSLPSLPANAPLEPKVQSSAGQVRNLVLEKNPEIGGWRLFFDLAGAGDGPVQLRASLQSGNKVLSETWVYRYQKP